MGDQTALLCEGISLRFPPALNCLPVKNITENNTDPVRADESQSHEGACSDQEPKRVFLTLHPTTLLLPTAAQPPETLTSRHRERARGRTVPRPGPRGGLTAKVVRTNHSCFKDSTTGKGVTSTPGRSHIGVWSAWLNRRPHSLSSVSCHCQHMLGRPGAAPPNFQLSSELVNS